MEIHIDKAGNIAPKGSETYVAATLAPQELADKSPPKITGYSVHCPDCDKEKWPIYVPFGTPYDHQC